MTHSTDPTQGHFHAAALVVPLIVVVIVLAGVVPTIRSAASEATDEAQPAADLASGDHDAYDDDDHDAEVVRYRNLAAMAAGHTQPVSDESRPWWPASARETRVAEPAPEIGETTRLVIPAIDVDATVVGVGRRADGSLDVPDFGLAGWYTPGPTPGAPGPAVIAAHVDSRSGPDVFFRLRELEPGDVISVFDAEGESVDFVVERREQQPKDALPVDRIWNDTDEPVLRLITCGGEFDRSVRSYRSNVIVYAAKA